MSNKIKEHFTSRYGENGYIVEADWSQLELIGWALSTKDPFLIKLINSGQDVHRFVGSKILKCRPEDIDDNTRKNLKGRNFLLVFGGHWYKLVYDHGMGEEEAENLYNTFWNLFPAAKLVQDNWVKEVEGNSYLVNDFTPSGLQRREGWYQDQCGRKYFFRSYDYSKKSREHGIKTKFKIAEIFNNRIQGFCTANLHLFSLGYLWRQSLPHRDKFLLINTVHDSIILDCKEKYLDFACNFIKEKMEYVKIILQNKFNVAVTIPLEVEVKYGRSWSSMVEYKSTKSKEVVNE